MKKLYIYPIASFLMLVISLTISAVPYFFENQIVIQELAISTLQSSETNPWGYLVASAGPLLSTFFIFPILGSLYSTLSLNSLTNTTIGITSLVLSLVTICINGVLSLLDYSGRLHADLATLSFIFSIVAVLFLLHASRQQNYKLSVRHRYYLNTLLTLCYLTITALLFIWLGPDYLGWQNPLDNLGINPWHIIGLAELLMTFLIYMSLIMIGYWAEKMRSC